MLRGVAIIVLLALNLAVWGVPILLGGVVRLLMPTGELRRRVVLILAPLAERWMDINHRIFDLFLDTEWDVQGVGEIRRDGRYLIVSNHVSWVDIFAVFRGFLWKSSLIRFFLKRELIWMPIVGQACWALEFPFMRRYTAEELARHPEKRGQDLETTRRACRHYRKIPVAILNYIEGTRFTRDKHEEQQSPYRYLLRPRVGGIAFVLASLGEQLDAMFDVTLAYPGHEVSMWDFITNRVPRITIRVRRLDIPPEFFDAAITEPGPERERFKAWIETLWREKDELLARLLEP